MNDVKGASSEMAMVDVVRGTLIFFARAVRFLAAVPFLFAFIALLLLGHQSGWAAATATLLNPVAKIDYGKTDGPANLIPKVDGRDAAGLANPKLLVRVIDLVAPAGGPTVRASIVAQDIAPEGLTYRWWLLALEVSGIPLGTNQTRWLSVRLPEKEDRDISVPYTLSNAPIGN